MLSRAPDALDADRLFAQWSGLSGVLLAVSGGPDSLALMRLAAQWRDAGATPLLFVATVDHALRENSAAEALEVGAWARALNLPHETLVWRGEKPTTAIQERAREARYALLFAHAERIGAQAVATAHHADDQWETIVLRLARGSGLAGLAGMARDQLFPGGRVIRPLLDVPKQNLVEYCLGVGQDFFEDPSNADPAYARAHLRLLARPLQDFGFSRDRAQRLAERAGKADAALDWAAEGFFALTALPEPHSYDLKALEQAPEAIFERFLQKALIRAAGTAPTRLERLESLAAHLRDALRREKAFRATLGGCSVSLNAKKRLSVTREKPRNRGKAAEA